MRRDPPAVAASLALAVGIPATSTGAIPVRFAPRDVPSVTIAACRLGIATLVLAPFALARHRRVLGSLEPGQLRLAAAAGLCLAVHFATWILAEQPTAAKVPGAAITLASLAWSARGAPAEA